jgi:hypothetical protein
MIAICTANDWEYFGLRPSRGNPLSVEGSMIDAVLTVGVFTTLGLCIIGFGAWAHK